MTQAEIETELRALRAELEAQASRDQSREVEWRRLGHIAKASSILASLAGLGFIITKAMTTTPSNALFQDQLAMMSVFFILLAVPLMIIGQALHKSPRMTVFRLPVGTK